METCRTYAWKEGIVNGGADPPNSCFGSVSASHCVLSSGFQKPEIRQKENTVYYVWRTDYGV